MKFAHYVSLRIFVKEGEDEERIRQKLLGVISYDEDKDKINILQKTHIISDEKKLRVLTLEIKKPSIINRFLKNIFSKISESNKKMLLEQIESRLDETLHFYIRLDKEEFLNDKLELTEGGHCLHIKIAVAAYPHDRDVAKSVVEKMMSI